MSDIEDETSEERREDEMLEKLMDKMNKEKVSDVTIDVKPAKTRAKKQPEPAPVAPAKKPRKPRGPPSEKQKAGLAKGREKAKMNAEIRRLEKEQELLAKKNN